MTHRNGVADGHDHDVDIGARDIGARGRGLAERRLGYLTELFESGRWRRYYSERAFLEDIQQAKAAVALWRNLSMPQPIPPAKPNGEVKAEAEPIIVQATAVIDTSGAGRDAARDEMLAAPVPTAADEETAQAKATEARYALLRNML
jgi:uncharacterized repeat protein (TIGR03809 family)